MQKFFKFISLLFLIAIIGFAAPSSSISDSKENAQDDRFIANDNGVVKDAETGLEWLAGPDKPTNWYDAKKWVLSLHDFAGGGWRMPTIEELITLHQKREKCNIKPNLITTGCWVWSDETKDSSSAWGYDYHHDPGSGIFGRDSTGHTGSDFLNRDDSTEYTRGFAVRFRK